MKLLGGYLRRDGPRKVRAGIPVDVFSPAGFDPTLYRRAPLPPGVEIFDTCHAYVNRLGQFEDLPDARPTGVAP